MPLALMKKETGEGSCLLVRVKGKGFLSWCANAHFRFPLTSRGSRGSYAAAFPGPFLLVLRPEAIASS